MPYYTEIHHLFFFPPKKGGHPCVVFFLVNDMYIWEDHLHDGSWFAWFSWCSFWRSVCQSCFFLVRLAASHSPSGTRRLLLFFLGGFHAKKRCSKTSCLSTREHVFYLGTFLYLKSSAPVWVQAFSMMQPMFRKLDQQEVHTTGSEREVCVFVAWAQN